MATLVHRFFARFTDDATSQPILRPQTILRPLLLAAAGFTLLTAMWAGLLRLGWNWPPLQPTLPMLHGPLMISGFLGTLICLERAVGLGQRWAYSAPILAGGGALALIVGVPGPMGALLITAGSLVLIIILGQIWRIQPALFTATIVLGGLVWLAGNGLWLAGWMMPNIVFWWAGFLILTIVGERLELSRILRLSTTAQVLFFATLLLFLAGLVVTLDQFDLGVRLVGVGMIAQSAWLLYYDIARRRVKAGGQARFMALSLLVGYGWLGVSGLLALVNGGAMAGPRYDAMLHTLFLGFVFSMIFAHALIIFPAVVRRSMVYSPRFYTHLILLHATLLLRITGDLLPWWPGRLWGGLLNVLVLLLFLVNTIASIKSAKQ